jgi:non-ribosomal peptide synthetase component F
VAVVCGDGVLTYAALDAAASRLAWYLIGRGIGPEQVVAVAMDRSAELLVTVLAVLKAGAVYLPMDPGYPPARIAYMLADAAPTCVLATAQAAAALPVGGPAAVIVDDPAVTRVIAACPPAAPADADRTVPLYLAHPAYVIYTSGSTGQPKGVVVTHRELGNHLLSRARRFGWGEPDRFLQNAPLSFDASVWQLLCPLVIGATTVLARPGGEADPGYLAGLVRRAGVTVAHFVASMLRVFLDEGDLGGLGSLRQVQGGGEAVSGSLRDAFFRVLPSPRATAARRGSRAFRRSAFRWTTPGCSCWTGGCARCRRE